MLPAHFHDVVGDLSGHNIKKNIWIVQILAIVRSKSCIQNHKSFHDLSGYVL